MYFVTQSHIIQILIPYLLVSFGIYCRNPHLPLNEVTVHQCRQLNQPNTMVHTNQQTCPKFLQMLPFLFRIPAKHITVVFYSTVSPQKCTELNTEKQHAQGHLGSNLTPGRQNRNFGKTRITNSTKPLCRPRGHLS